MVMHVKVLDVSESRLPSVKQAFLRDIGDLVVSVAAVSYLIFLVVAHQYVKGDEQVNHLPGRIVGWASLGWFWVEVITMLSNKKRRALHDLIARTVVCFD